MDILKILSFDEIIKSVNVQDNPSAYEELMSKCKKKELKAIMDIMETETYKNLEYYLRLKTKIMSPDHEGGEAIEKYYRENSYYKAFDDLKGILAHLKTYDEYKREMVRNEKGL